MGGLPGDLRELMDSVEHSSTRARGRPHLAAPDPDHSLCQNCLARSAVRDAQTFPRKRRPRRLRGHPDNSFVGITVVRTTADGTLLLCGTLTAPGPNRRQAIWPGSGDEVFAVASAPSAFLRSTDALAPAQIPSSG